ncbi:hypothetical protein CDAR_195711 [Caerostris darwini]|uniref:Uncharacterized protein n=1 Tax=Caerostris darwini TaxID=1538125 RepID=A0AAV4SA37_9ARAC|nr:hypothetical protein CDAR_195711 [Caerostris darwini]
MGELSLCCLIGHLKPGPAPNCHPVLAGLFELTMNPQSDQFAPLGICSIVTKQNMEKKKEGLATSVAQEKYVVLADFPFVTLLRPLHLIWKKQMAFGFNEKMKYASTSK